jgi:hypothetical protein
MAGAAGPPPLPEEERALSMHNGTERSPAHERTEKGQPTPATSHGTQNRFGPYEQPRAAPGWQRPEHRGRMQARWVRRGITVDFERGVKPQGFHYVPSRTMDEKLWRERKAERDRTLAMGAFVPAPTQDRHELVRRGHMICPAFLVPKKGKTNRYRMVINQIPLNRLCKARRIRFQGLKNLRHAGQKGCWAFTWDLENGYMVLQVFKPHQKYMTVDLGPSMAADGEPISASNPRYVLCNCMPFGYLASPWYFVKTMKVIQEELHKRGVTCQMWLDDGIVLCDTRELALRHRSIVEEVLGEFGLTRQKTKGEWEPTQDLEHLGVGVNTAAGVFYVTAQRKRKLSTEAKRIVCSAKRHKRWVGARWLAEFAGLAMSTHDAVAQCAHRLRPLFDVLAAAQVWLYGYGQQVRLTPAAFGALQWWIDTMRVKQGNTGSNPGGLAEMPLNKVSPGRPEAVLNEESPNTQLEKRLMEKPPVGKQPCKPIWRAPVTQVITTDASGEGAAEAPGGGWGATLGGAPLNRVRPDRDNGQAVRGIWAVEDRDLHITPKELKAVRYALEAWRVQLRNRHVLLWEDNQAVVGILRRLNTKSPGMRAELEQIIDLLEEENIVLQVRYIKSAVNPSDWYSRIRDKSEWRLRYELADRLLHYFGTAEVDRFADSALALLPRFNAAYPCRGAETVDAFTVSWEGTHSWVNPPWNHIGRVLYKLWHEPAAAATLLLPVWPSAEWWPLLLRLATTRVSVHFSAADIVPGPLMLPDMTPEPLMNSGWRLQLAYVPPRRQTPWSRFSDSVNTGTGLAGEWR